MVSHLFYYQLALLAIIWLFVMLHVTWSKRAASAPPQPCPAKPKRRRSSEPKPFAGLRRKPSLSRNVSKRRWIARQCRRDGPIPYRPRTAAPGRWNCPGRFCPHPECDYRGWRGLNNLRANGHPTGGPWRQLHCLGCNGYFPEHHGTIFYGKPAPVELIVRVLACLTQGLGTRATARVFEVDANTVLQWLGEAAEQLQALSRYFLCDVHLTQLQLDELYAVLRDRKAGEIGEDEAIKRLGRSPYWVWTALDPNSKVLLVIDVGARTLEMAQRIVHQVAQVLAPRAVCRCA